MNFEERRFGKNWHLLFYLSFAGFASLREAYDLGCYLREIRSTFGEVELIANSIIGQLDN